MKGFVIFNNEQEFISLEVQACQLLSIPYPNKVLGKINKSKQWTACCSEAITHPDQEDNRVCAYIGENWPDSLRDGFVYYTAEEINNMGW